MFLLALALASTVPGEPLSRLPLERTVSLEGDTAHVQGLAVRNGRFWVTAVDRRERKGYVFEFDETTGKRLRAVEVQQGDRYHPGGIAADSRSLWIPVAEYRRDGRTTIERRSLETLAVESRFDVPDHIGCLALFGDRLIGGNWDARTIYEWTLDGRLLQKRENPHALRVQDWKSDGGLLAAAGLNNSGGELRWLDPHTLETRRLLELGATSRNINYGREGMDIAAGKLYLLPEDSPSRVFVFALAPQSGGGTRALEHGSLNRKERLEWFRDLGFGMFIHWGVDVNLGSVISHSLVGASQDYVRRYFDILPRYFNPDKLDARKWAAAAKLAGMRYAVFTTKHHSGFAMWDTTTTPFNVMNTPYRKDIVRQFVDAFRAEGIAIGFYISPDDFWWFHQNGVEIKRPPATMTTTRELPALREYDIRQVRELFTGYGKIDVFFIDGPPDGLREEAWRLQPDVVVTRGAIDTPEQHVPGIPMDVAWEACITIGDAWQHKPADQPKSSRDLLQTLIEIRAKGGNLLLNVGPRPDGELSVAEEGRLRDIALWQFVNSESLDAVRPWIITNEQQIWFTRKKNEPTVYAFVTSPPWKLAETRTLTIKSVRSTPATTIEILGQSGEVLEYRPEVRPKTTWKQDRDGLHITATTAQRMYDDRRWDKPVVLKITHAEPALTPPQVLTLDRQGRTVRGELRSLGDAAEVEVGFEYRPRKGLTDLYEKTEPWRSLPLVKRNALGAFTATLPEGAWEYRALVKHPLLTLYGAER
jgi:alpha-L-fucosidase